MQGWEELNGACRGRRMDKSVRCRGWDWGEMRSLRRVCMATVMAGGQSRRGPTAGVGRAHSAGRVCVGGVQRTVCVTMLFRFSLWYRSTLEPFGTPHALLSLPPGQRPGRRPAAPRLPRVQRHRGGPPLRVGGRGGHRLLRRRAGGGAGGLPRVRGQGHGGGPAAAAVRQVRVA